MTEQSTEQEAAWYECPSCGYNEEASPSAPECTAYFCPKCDDDKLVLQKGSDAD